MERNCCKLTGFYILNFLSSKFGKEKTGLYRGDGLRCFQAGKVEKKICEMFQSCCLKITIKTDLHITDFLEVIFNLQNRKYYPFRKPNNDPLYINALYSLKPSKKHYQRNS